MDEDMARKINAVQTLCPPEMNFIYSGGFLMGWDNGEPDERPERVEFTGNYCIDAFEYPNIGGEIPTSNVTFDQAKQMCEEQGKRMCREKEWERACRGIRGTIYAPTQDYKLLPDFQCNLNSSGPAPAGACPSDYWLFDMTGNLWEWVDGQYSEDTPWPLIKGGAYKKGPLFSSCYARFTQPVDSASDGIGFRCCADVNQESLKIVTEGKPGLISSEDTQCPGYNVQHELIKESYRALREPDTYSIYHFDNARATDTSGAVQSSLLIIKYDSAELRTFTYTNGAVKMESSPVDLQAALDGAKKLIAFLRKNGVASYDGCFGCGSQCHYIAENVVSPFSTKPRPAFEKTPAMGIRGYWTTPPDMDFDIKNFLKN